MLVGDDDGLGGRALFAASVLDQLGARPGRRRRPAPEDGRPAHDRITYARRPAPRTRPSWPRSPTSSATTAPWCFVGLGATGRVTATFEAYAPLVPVDGYVVVENTVVNGRPVAPGFGPGPHEAVTDLLQRHRDFVPDVAFERYTVTFNKNGYLRRIAPA